MSFNFSDYEEEEDEFDLEEYDETGLLAQASRETEANAPAVAAKYAEAGALAQDGGDSDGGDWDNVDWEDADDEEEEADARSIAKTLPPAFPQEGITIHIGRRVGKSNDPDDNEQRKGIMSDEVIQHQPAKKKRRKSTIRVLRSVPPETQLLILNIRRAHLLCCLIHSLRCSFLCSEGGGDDNIELFSTALSLIPQEFHAVEHATNTEAPFIIPTATTVKEFSLWYFQFVHQAGQRRRRTMDRNAAQGAAAPTFTRKRRRRQSLTNSSLMQILRRFSPSYDDEPQMFIEQEGLDPIEAVECITAKEKVMMFLVMVRSLGWRARYVTALKPVPLKLTVDHPLFKVPSSPSSASLDVKPQAFSAGVFHKMMRLIDAKVKRNAKQVERKKGRDDAIDLLSSGEEDKEKTNQMKKVRKPDDLLSWIEVLHIKDDKEGEKIEMASTQSKNSKTKPAAKWTSILLEQETIDQPHLVENILGWMNSESDDVNKCREQVKSKRKWTSKKRALLDGGIAHRFSKKCPVSYVVAVEHLSTNSISAQGVRFTDVTKRYANTWSRTLVLRGVTSKDIKEGQCVDEWFQTSLDRLNKNIKLKATEPTADKSAFMKLESKSPVRSVTKVQSSDGKMVEVLELESSGDEDTKPESGNYSTIDYHDIDEKEELNGNSAQEVIPKSKAAFQNHPFYVIQSVLSSKEVLHPDSRKRICGVFKGELVYRRSDVSTALKAKKWLYEGRKVKETELQNPVKKIKARRKKPKIKGFQALETYGITKSAQSEAIALLDEMKEDAFEDEVMDNLYGEWQTEHWSPPYVSPSDPIPTNEFKNVEKELLNPGLTHMEQSGLAGIARKLGIPYAPCMIGFERHGGRGTPSIRGIVVHDHNVGLIREASIEWESHVAEKERSERRNEVVKRWKRLVVGLLTKERLERDYGSHLR